MGSVRQCLFGICLFLPAFAVAAPVDESAVTMASVGRVMVACVDEQPGILSSRNGTLNFTSMATLVQRLRRRGASAETVRQKRQLQKLGKRACDADSGASRAIAAVAAGSSEDISALTQVITPLTRLFAQAGGAVASNTRVSIRASLLDLLAELSDVLSCASIGVSNGKITVDLGDGCSVHGVSLSGSLSIGVSQSGGRLALEGETEGLTANGVTVSGSLSVVLNSGQDGGSFELDIALSLDGVTSDIQLAGSFDVLESAVTFNATGQFTTSGITGEIELQDLRKPLDDGCYPNGGILVLDPENAPAISVTFSEATPETREVSVQVGTLTPTVTTLPACG